MQYNMKSSLVKFAMWARAMGVDTAGMDTRRRLRPPSMPSGRWLSV